MKIKIFVISLYDDGTALDEMNRFLNGNKVLNVKEELVSNGSGSGAWTYSVPSTRKSCFAIACLCQPCRYKRIKKENN